MSFLLRRNNTYLIVTAFLLLLFIHFQYQATHTRSPQLKLPQQAIREWASLRSPDKYDWANRQPLYPLNTTFEPVPKPLGRLPRIQHVFRKETAQEAADREERRESVRRAFHRCWKSYREYAWLKDELTPVSASSKNTFGGWAATLVDSLDTLWIMDFKEEFEEAVDATMSIDFTNTTSRTISLFETNIRYLGGLLSAFDLSGDQRLALKALELGNTLYAAFDTPNHMPINDWDVQEAAYGSSQEAPFNMVSAQIGSLSLEFTRLAQITGDNKFYDAIHRIGMAFRDQQDKTKMPGMWPMRVNPHAMDFITGIQFSLGANADSLYEYLPKLHALLGGTGPYLEMYNKAMEAAIPQLLFKPMIPEGDILFASEILVGGTGNIVEPKPQHLVCFVGGMLALGGRLAQNETHVDAGRRMADGCVWAYRNSKHGVMPENFVAIPCADPNDCPWDEEKWMEKIASNTGLTRVHIQEQVAGNDLPKGFAHINDRSYILRPEAIESVFIMYRVSGDPEWMEKGWRMFRAVDKLTKTEYANSAVMDVTSNVPVHEDSMESFWTAETLKYFYLLFSPPSLIDLDDFVFNTEAHPLKRP